MLDVNKLPEGIRFAFSGQHRNICGEGFKAAVVNKDHNAGLRNPIPHTAKKARLAWNIGYATAQAKHSIPTTKNVELIKLIKAALHSS